MASEIEPAQIAEEYEQEMFVAWLETGVAAGWVSLPDCSTHQGIPMRPREEAEFEDGHDPCIITMRVWRDGYKQDGDER